MEVEGQENEQIASRRSFFLAFFVSVGHPLQPTALSTVTLVPPLAGRVLASQLLGLSGPHKFVPDRHGSQGARRQAEITLLASRAASLLLTFF